MGGTPAHAAAAGDARFQRGLERGEHLHGGDPAPPRACVRRPPRRHHARLLPMPGTDGTRVADRVPCFGADAIAGATTSSPASKPASSPSSPAATPFRLLLEAHDGEPGPRDGWRRCDRGFLRGRWCAPGAPTDSPTMSAQEFVKEFAARARRSRRAWVPAGTPRAPCPSHTGRLNQL